MEDFGQTNFMEWAGEDETEEEKHEIMDSLLESDLKMYIEQFDFENEWERHLAADTTEERPRYFSVGYEANYDPPNALEISRWQKHFPYLGVIGEGISEENDQNEQPEQAPAFEANAPLFSSTNASSEVNLSVVGSKIHFESRSPHEICEDLEEEEVLAQDGILEEIIDTDVSINQVVQWETDENHSGEHSVERDVSVEREQKMQRVQDLVERCWPEIAPLLEPMVKKVLGVIRKHNLPQDVEARAMAIRVLSGQCDDDKSSDGSGW